MVRFIVGSVHGHVGEGFEHARAQYPSLKGSLFFKERRFDSSLATAADVLYDLESHCCRLELFGGAFNGVLLFFQSRIDLTRQPYAGKVCLEYLWGGRAGGRNRPRKGDP